MFVRLDAHEISEGLIEEVKETMDHVFNAFRDTLRVCNC